MMNVTPGKSKYSSFEAYIDLAYHLQFNDRSFNIHFTISIYNCKCILEMMWCVDHVISLMWFVDKWPSKHLILIITYKFRSLIYFGHDVMENHVISLMWCDAMIWHILTFSNFFNRHEEICDIYIYLQWI